LKSGRLRHKIVIQQRVETKNSIGEDITAYTTYKEVWAQVAPLSSKEYVSNNELQSSITGRVSMRYLSGVTSDMRIKWGSRIFDIVGPPINTDERNRELILMVEEQL